MSRQIVENTEVVTPVFANNRFNLLLKLKGLFGG